MPVTREPITAGAILRAAETAVDGPRAREHGDKLLNMQTTEILQDALRRAERLAVHAGQPTFAPGVSPALDMVMVKISRMLCGEFNPDDFTDAAGYIAIAGECASKAEGARG